jgi:hypothetical protein
MENAIGERRRETLFSLLYPIIRRDAGDNKYIIKWGVEKLIDKMNRGKHRASFAGLCKSKCKKIKQIIILESISNIIAEVNLVIVNIVKKVHSNNLRGIVNKNKKIKEGSILNKYKIIME